MVHTACAGAVNLAPVAALIVLASCLGVAGNRPLPVTGNLGPGLVFVEERVGRADPVDYPSAKKEADEASAEAAKLSPEWKKAYQEDAVKAMDTGEQYAGELKALHEGYVKLYRGMLHLLEAIKEAMKKRAEQVHQGITKDEDKAGITGKRGCSGEVKSVEECLADFETCMFTGRVALAGSTVQDLLGKDNTLYEKESEKCMESKKQCVTKATTENKDCLKVNEEKTIEECLQEFATCMFDPRDALGGECVQDLLGIDDHKYDELSTECMTKKQSCVAKAQAVTIVAEEVAKPDAGGREGKTNPERGCAGEVKGIEECLGDFELCMFQGRAEFKGDSVQDLLGKDDKKYDQESTKCMDTKKQCVTKAEKADKECLKQEEAKTVQQCLDNFDTCMFTERDDLGKKCVQDLVASDANKYLEESNKCWQEKQDCIAKVQAAQMAAKTVVEDKGPEDPANKGRGCQQEVQKMEVCLENFEICMFQGRQELKGDNVQDLLNKDNHKYEDESNKCMNTKKECVSKAQDAEKKCLQEPEVKTIDDCLQDFSKCMFDDRSELGGKSVQDLLGADDHKYEAESNKCMETKQTCVAKAQETTTTTAAATTAAATTAAGTTAAAAETTTAEAAK